MGIREVRKLKSFTASSNESRCRLFSSFSLVDKEKWREFIQIEKPSRIRWCSRKFQSNENSIRFLTTKMVGRDTIPVARKTQWIPGILGSLVSLVVSDRAIKLHEYVDQLHKELGPIYRDKIGPVEAIFLNSPDDFRKIFRLEGATPMHFLPEAWGLYNQIRECPRGLLFMDGEEWLHFRRIMNKVMLIPNPENIMVPRCLEAANDLVEDLMGFANSGVTIPELETRLYRWSIEVMLATLIGSSWKIYKPRVEKETMNLARILHRVFALSAKLSLIPAKYAMKMRLPVWREFCLVVDQTLGIVSSIVSDIARFNGDGLLSLMVKEGITSEKDLVRIVTDLVIASGDTTAFSTQWSLLTLARNLEVQKKFYERIKCFDERDIMADNYVKAIMKEVLRLYPTAPFLTRFMPEDAFIAGHRVPKGELILMSMWSSGRDVKNFPKPDDFCPERWMRNEHGNYEQVVNPHGSLPFALGARSCVGRKLAETQMALTLSQIQNIHHTCCSRQHEGDLRLRGRRVERAPMSLELPPGGICSRIWQIVKNFRIECPNANTISMILHLIAVPSEPVKLRLHRR